MRRTMVLTALGLGALTVLGPASHAQTYMDLEHARANARAGGPVSEYDANLLRRYGCLSGTNSAFCRDLRNGGKKAYRKERRRVRRD